MLVPLTTLIGATILGCAGSGEGFMDTATTMVRGTVKARDKQTLPSAAVMEVKLLDVSLQDVAAPVIAEKNLPLNGMQFPIPFELPYDPDKIEQNRTYAVRATILVEGKMIYTTDTMYGVLTRGKKDMVEMILVPAGKPPAPAGNIERSRSLLYSYTAVEGETTMGDNATTWTAYYDGDELKHIKEHSNQGDYGTAENEYWFEGGKLIAYSSRGKRTVTDPSKPAGTDQVAIDLTFDAAGNPAGQSKTVNGVSATAGATEVSGAQARAAVLAEEARKTLTAPTVVFQAPASRSGRIFMSGKDLRFLPCGESGKGTKLQDLPGGDAKSLLKEFGQEKAGITVMIRTERNRLTEIRYAGAEGPKCDQLPPAGEVMAQGNEPFWNLVVDGATARLRTLEEPQGVAYGSGKWSKPDDTHWVYKAKRDVKDGFEYISLEFTAQPCADDMSGQRYPYKAVFTRGGKKMYGCALEGARATGVPPQAAQEKGGTMKGTVAYRERIALTPDAVVDVWMTDISPGVTTQEILGETSVETKGKQVPIPFEIKYDPKRVVRDHDYGVKAVIRAGGRIMFESKEWTRVITKGTPTEANLVLVMAKSGSAPPAGSLLNTEWRLAELDGKPVLENVEATLAFPEEGKVAGKGSCNRFFGSVVISGGSISFSNIGSTLMACPEPTMTQEREYMRALEGAERWEVEGETLYLYSRGLEKPARFVRKKG